MTSESEIVEAINGTLISSTEEDSDGDPANVVDGLFELSRSIRSGLRWLGNGDAATSMGAIEALGKCILDAGEKVSDALNNVAEAIREREE